MKEDLLDASQSFPVIEEKIDIPPFSQHQKQIRTLWRLCISLATVIFLGGTSAVVALASHEYTISAILGISTIAFQIIVMSYGAGVFVPGFLASLKNLGVSVRMMYVSLKYGKEAADTMVSLRDDAKPTIDRFERISKKMEPVADRIHEVVVENNVLEQIASDMKAIRERIDRDTAPVGVNRRREEAPVDGT